MFAFAQHDRSGELVIDMIDTLDAIFKFYGHPLLPATRARIEAKPEGAFFSFRSGYSGVIRRVS
jgi:hypothetical protein